MIDFSKLVSGMYNGQSSMSSIDFSISSVLSNGPYDGSRPAMSRSRMARVSALGMCSSSSVVLVALLDG